MPYQDQKISGIQGLNEDETSDQLGPLELTEAINTARFGSSYGTRPGIAFESSTPGTGVYTAQVAAGLVQGGIEFGKRNNTTDNWLVSVVNGNVYYDSGSGALTKTGVTISTTGRWTFAQYNGTLYGAGGSNGDEVWSWPGGTGDALSQVTFQSDTNADGVGDADIDAKYIFEKWNYMFLGGMNGTLADDNPMIVRYSALGDPTTWPVGNSIGGTSAIGGFDSYGGNSVTGFAEFSAGGREWLLVLTEKRIYSVLQIGDPETPFHVDDTIANGCVAQQAFVSLGVDSGDAIYVSRKGIHSLRQSQQFGGREDAFLSWKIRQTFQTANFSTLQNSSGVYMEKEGLVLFAIPIGSNTWPDTILCLDIKGVEQLSARTAKWSIWRPNIGDGVGITSMWTSRDATTQVEHVYIGTTDGRVGRFQRVVYSDFGSAYSVKFRTKDEDFGASRSDKGIGDLLATIRFTSSGATVQYQTVFNRGTRSGSPQTLLLGSSQAQWDVAVWDQALWGSSTQEVEKKIYGVGSGRTISHRFTGATNNQPFFLVELGYQVDLRDESVEREAN
jgi:hypothetical protein